jgi:hypothetical protein
MTSAQGRATITTRRGVIGASAWVAVRVPVFSPHGAGRNDNEPKDLATSAPECNGEVLGGAAVAVVPDAPVLVADRKGSMDLLADSEPEARRYCGSMSPGFPLSFIAALPSSVWGPR